MSDGGDLILATFGPLRVGYDERVLEPRLWTLLQADWAVEQAAHLARGPVLELCCGAGQIGQVVALRTGRDLVQVDASAVACRHARANARRNGLAERVAVRRAEITAADRPDLGRHAFQLVLADPPYVPTADCDAFPDDPLLAIDGGPEGLDVVEVVAASIAHHLAPDGVALLQVRGPAQVDALEARDLVGLEVADIRSHDAERAVALLRPSPDAGRSAPGAGQHLAG
ncbi:methyltransferase [Dermatobacter hominis]|uniref:methyltransferase n=1 Tax=Dermatobacter hominis TaxID=2884263 RepID=UPI001D0F5AF5|nr:class I SAM-dependent methyltransferase [Dermatobacter hominis]UDY34153.1 class I SAM-dependent methyltransferase [Dermatobacter hominis]